MNPNTVACSLCEAKCIFQGEGFNIATTSKDGTIYCIQCYDVALFVGDLSEAPKQQPRVVAHAAMCEPSPKPAPIATFCPKCKVPFETQCPTCDMINPLSRSVQKKKKKKPRA
jgi:hypothetical protein